MFFVALYELSHTKAVEYRYNKCYISVHYYRYENFLYIFGFIFTEIIVCNVVICKYIHMYIIQ